MSILEGLPYLLAVVAVVFPVAYCARRVSRNRLMFVAMVFGFQFMLESLLFAAVLPAIVFTVYGVPQLQAFGIQLNSYAALSEFLVDHGWWLVHGVLLFTLPVLVHRRYRRYFAVARPAVE